jgi:hypothetical protein
MWRQANYVEDCGITVRSFSSKIKTAAIDKKYRFSLFFGTYESRGLVSSKLLGDQSCTSSLIVFFKEKDSRGLRDKYDKILHDQVRKCTKQEPGILDNVSVSDVEKTFSAIIHKIPKDALSPDAEWFIDMVGSPKPYILALLGYLRRQIISPRLCLFHPSAYYEAGETADDAFTFTSGLDRYVWVPWLWGMPIPAAPWAYFFLLGFEGNRSYEIYAQFEPIYTLSLVGNPGYRKKYYSHALRENKRFFDEASPVKIEAHASDVALAWRKIRQAFLKVERNAIRRNQRINKCIVPLGPKPHAIAGCLAALCDPSCSILYLMPRTYKVHDVQPGDTVWRYEVTL